MYTGHIQRSTHARAIEHAVASRACCAHVLRTAPSTSNTAEADSRAISRHVLLFVYRLDGIKGFSCWEWIQNIWYELVSTNYWADTYLKLFWLLCYVKYYVPFPNHLYRSDGLIFSEIFGMDRLFIEFCIDSEIEGSVNWGFVLLFVTCKL